MANSASTAEIFVSVASFRDVFLPFTLESVVNGALHPERLRFGICWQSDETESLSPYLSDPRFRVIRYPYEESLGYAWARAEIQRLYRGEPYHLLIDSHSYMAKNWDVELIEELESKPCAKPVLSTSSPPFRFDDQGGVVLPWVGTNWDGVPRLRCRQHPPGWLDIQMSRERSADPNEPTYFLCCNFLFTHGRWILEAPEDPEMLNAAHEGPLSARSYTYGYDAFLPEKLYTWHLDYNEYEGGERHKVWDATSQEWQSEGTEIMIDRLRSLWSSQGAGGLGAHGIGTVRPLKEWAAKAGVDLSFVEERECDIDRTPFIEK